MTENLLQIFIVSFGASLMTMVQHPLAENLVVNFSSLF